ncbi:hypothetical protein EYV94_04890 [Puteibacter caeruleilacunae]|nr:hypothetical protein EYV94_04890 [Puteibacter caeruleilacunae]
MKQFTTYITLLLLCGFSVFFSCEKMDEVHEEFMGEGETLYLPKADSVKFFPGNNRAKLKFTLDNAVQVKQVAIYWNNEQDSLVETLSPTSGIDTIQIDMNDLEEGSHQLLIRTKDGNGNQSIGVNVFGVTYGEIYRSVLKHRSIKKKKVTPSIVELTWTHSAEKAIGFEVKYIDEEGNEHVNKHPVTETVMEFEDIQIGSILNHRMYYLPEENALDTFSTDWQEVAIVLPEGEFQLDKSQMKEYPLKNDNRGRSWGGSVDKLFDGNVSSGNFYHTGSGGSSDGPPLTFTFDAGETCKFTRLKFHARPGQIPRLPKDFEIWATNDIEGAETDLPCTDDGWEAEAIEKGWKKILVHVGEGDAPSNGELEVAFPEDLEYMRYVRVKVDDLWGDTYMLNFSEITMWGEY